MFSHQRHIRKFAKSAAFVAASSILFVAATQATEVTGDKLMLTAYVNGSGGESLMSGKYDVALAEMASGPRERFDGLQRQDEQSVRRLRRQEATHGSEGRLHGRCEGREVRSSELATLRPGLVARELVCRDRLYEPRCRVDADEGRSRREGTTSPAPSRSRRPQSSCPATWLPCRTRAARSRSSTLRRPADR